MLQSITINNLALIEEACIEFGEGFQVLTGETGAGKSIVVDAVNLILGGRADREMIRTGADKAKVEAVFDIPGHKEAADLMARESIDYDGRTVTITREISINGRNVCRVCGTLVSLSLLKEISAMILDLHGQSEHQYLADPAKHLSFLDATGDGKHRTLLERVDEDYSLFISNHRMYAGLVRGKEEREKRISGIEHDLAVLRKAGLKEDEEAKLQEEKKRLLNSEKRTEAIRRACLLINGSEVDESVLSRIRESVQAVRELEEKDGEAFRGMTQRLENACYELEEIAYELSAAEDQADSEPERLEKVEKRLDLIRRLENKHGRTIPEIIANEKAMGDELKKLKAADEQMKEMSAEHKKLLQRYRQSARELHESREKLALNLTKMMENELNELGMADTRFGVDFLPPPDNRPQMPTRYGDDSIEFMISPNPGEPLKPMAKIASGGELSRIMLAFKNLEAGFSGVHSMVFDEIDTGISGRMAQAVSEKLISISRKRQVICVTHLPQIAAAADDQYLVVKEVRNNRTETSVLRLDASGRNREIARLISGAEGITEEALDYAGNMLKAAENMKMKLNPDIGT